MANNITRYNQPTGFMPLSEAVDRLFRDAFTRPRMFGDVFPTTSRFGFSTSPVALMLISDTRAELATNPSSAVWANSPLISSISATWSYGTSASASSTFMWPGMRPATGWIA